MDLPQETITRQERMRAYALSLAETFADRCSSATSANIVEDAEIFLAFLQGDVHAAEAKRAVR